MARRGDSSSIILLLICLIVLVGGVAAGYVAVDKKIIENPFASLLQEEPTAPTSEPLSVPATSTEETDFFMKENRPKPGGAPIVTQTDSLNLTPGTTINCKRFPFSGDTTSTLYMYEGNNNVSRYPNSDIAQSWGASSTSSSAISCRGLTKGVDIKGNWPTGTTVKCSANDKVGSTDTRYYYINHGKLMKYESTGAIDYYDPNWRSATKTIPDCSDYTLDSSYTIFDPRPPAVGGLMENASYKLKAGDRYCGGSAVVNFTCKDVTTESAHTFQIQKDTTGAFPGYPYVIYNVTRGTYCRATDDSDDDGSYNFNCETADANTPNNTSRSWERFNIELKSDGTYAIKSYLSGKYLRLYVHSYYDEMYADAGSIDQATSFTFEPDDSSATGSSMPANLPLLNTSSVNSHIQCKSFPPIGGTTETIYKYIGNNTIQGYVDDVTAKSWDSNPRSVNCMGATTSGDTISHGGWPSGTLVKCKTNDLGGYYYKYGGNGGLMPYPDKTTFDSWEPNGGTSAVSIPNCSTYNLVDAGIYKYVNWSLGIPVKCASNDPKGAPSEQSVFSYYPYGVLRYYPDVETLNKLDPDWGSTYKVIPNCQDYTLHDSEFGSAHLQLSDTYYTMRKNNYGGPCAVDDTSKKITCKPTNTATKFKLETVDWQTRAIKAFFDGPFKYTKYCADTADGFVCDRDSLGSWEKTKLEAWPNDAYTLNGGRADNKCALDSNKVLKCNLPSNSTLGDKFILSTTPAPEGSIEDKMADVKAAVSAAIEEGSKPSTPAPAPGSPVNCVGGWIAGTQYTERAPSGKCWQISGLTGGTSRRLDRTLQPEKYIITTQPQSGGAACPHENAATRTKVIAYNNTCGGPSRTGNQSSPAVNGYIT